MIGWAWEKATSSLWLIPPMKLLTTSINFFSPPTFPRPTLWLGTQLAESMFGSMPRFYPTQVTGLVLLDSAHEEQFSRVSEISPEWAKRISDRFPADEQRAQGFLPQNARLAWHFNGPLIVIEHGRMPPSAASDPMAKQSEDVFQLLQKDLVSRSKYGQLRVAEKSGHYIQRDQPELVTQATKDVIRESATPPRRQ